MAAKKSPKKKVSKKTVKKATRASKKTTAKIQSQEEVSQAPKELTPEELEAQHKADIERQRIEAREARRKAQEAPKALLEEPAPVVEDNDFSDEALQRAKEALEAQFRQQRENREVQRLTELEIKQREEAAKREAEIAEERRKRKAEAAAERERKRQERNAANAAAQKTNGASNGAPLLRAVPPLEDTKTLPLSADQKYKLLFLNERLNKEVERVRRSLLGEFQKMINAAMEKDSSYLEARRDQILAVNEVIQAMAPQLPAGYAITLLEPENGRVQCTYSPEQVGKMLPVPELPV